MFDSRGISNRHLSNTSLHWKGARGRHSKKVIVGVQPFIPVGGWETDVDSQWAALQVH